jgi:hypothetical protein
MEDASSKRERKAKHLAAAVRVAARRSSRVLQRAKRLPHVMEVAQRGIEFLRRRGGLGRPRRRAPAAAAQVRNEEKDGRDGESEKAGEHGESEANEMP